MPPPPVSIGLAIVLGLYPTVYLAVLFHEIGHAIAGSLAGFTITSFGLGTEHPFFKARLPGGTIFYLCRNNPLFGICWDIPPERIMPRRRHVALLLGGALTNLSLVIPAALLWRATHGGFWLVFAAINLLIGLVNLIPQTQRFSDSPYPYASDGLHIVKTLLSKQHHFSLPQNYTHYKSLWEAIGDHRAIRYELCRVAQVAITLGDQERAAEYLIATNQLPADNNDTALALAYGSWHRLRREDDIARTFFLKAREQFQERKQYANLFLVDLSLISLQTDPAMALVAWKALESSLPSPLAQNPMVLLSLASARLTLFFREKSDDSTMLETLLARYEDCRRRLRSDTMDADIYSSAAFWRQKQGDTVGAQLAWEQATQAILVIDRALTSAPELREGYRQRVTASAIQAALPSPFAEAIPALTG